MATSEAIYLPATYDYESDQFKSTDEAVHCVVRARLLNKTRGKVRQLAVVTLKSRSISDE